MIDTLRVLVSWKCNLTCSYCCNEQPRFRDPIRPTKLSEIDFSRYQNVCISGGEPLLFPDRIRAVCSLAQDSTIILYTNGVFLNAGMAGMLEQWGVDFVNVGLHEPKSFAKLIESVSQAVLFTKLAVRFHIQDIYETQITRLFPDVPVRFWKMDDCDRANEERVVLTDWDLPKPLKP